MNSTPRQLNRHRDLPVHRRGAIALVECSGRAATVLRNLLVACALIAALLAATTSSAVTPKSPEVRELISKGLRYLEKAEDERLGAWCLAGVAAIKADRPDHPAIAAALERCKKDASLPSSLIDVYSNGLAVIFLTELDAKRHDDLIRNYFGKLKARQKNHGGWGYDYRQTGDTSQTQYGALGSWQAYQTGFGLDDGRVADLADWLIHTQDEEGGWGYQGKYSEGSQRVAQSKVNCTMVAAAMGCCLITADLFGILRSASVDSSQTYQVPDALKAANQERKRPPLSSGSLDKESLFKAIQAGDKWMAKNFKIKMPKYTVYYLYALERYKSFKEIMDGDAPKEPDWYNKGYEYLRKTQGEDGHWDDGCQEMSDTSLAILFLLRSTQKSLNKGFGEGALLSGRGLPTNLAGAKLSRGQVIAQQTAVKVTDLLNMIDEDTASRLDDLANSPESLVLQGDIDDSAARKLQQLVRGGSPKARLIATRTLARTGKLDYVPILLYAMTDPDKGVVIQARDGLRLVSRRFGGYGLPDNFTDAQRYTAIDRWKQWYLSIRPDAVLEID